MKKRLPKLAIVGRPNVGKSALFNRLCKQKRSIVDEAEGVTRDRLYALADYFGHLFEIIDTGGVDPNSKISFNEAVRRQAEIAMEEADVLVFVVDGQVGLTELDSQVAQILHHKKKPVSVAVNKIDDAHFLDRVYEFHALGFEKVIGISASHGFQVAELLETAFQDIVWEEEEIEEDRIKISIVGRPNVGKSTLINFLLQEERCIVSPIAGTTRDSIDIDLDIEQSSYRFIDTAGIRRKKKEHEVVDKFAAIRTKRAIERSDICLLLLDAKDGMTIQERKIASEIEALGKGCILLFNKWDLVRGFRMEHCLQAIRKEVSFLNHCPTLFISAKTGQNIKNIYKEIDRVFAGTQQRISTGELNRFLEKAMQNYHPPMLKGKRLRIYYIAQVSIQPPRFALFVNSPTLMVDSYQKYLVNSFRKTFQFSGVPLLFSLKGKKKKMRSKTQVIPFIKNKDA